MGAGSITGGTLVAITDQVQNTLAVMLMVLTLVRAAVKLTRSGREQLAVYGGLTESNGKTRILRS
jgi:hypothetical protein